jgi:hypothetical protein
MDDFRASQIKFSELLTVLDRYPKHVEVKGGYRWHGGKNTVITSNEHPKDCYFLPDEDIKQLLTRLDYIIEFTPVTQIIHCDPQECLRSRGNTRTRLLNIGQMQKDTK